MTTVITSSRSYTDIQEKKNCHQKWQGHYYYRTSQLDNFCAKQKKFYISLNWFNNIQPVVTFQSYVILSVLYKITLH